MRQCAGGRARGGRRAAARLRATPTRPRAQALLDRGAAPPAGAGSSATPAATAGELLRVLDTVALAADAYGPQAVAAFVISMTEQPSDVLARAAGWRSAPGASARCGWCRCSRRAPTSSARRRRWPRSTPASPTASALRAQGDRQTVMVGYSDSGKDTRLRGQPVGALRRAGAARARRPASTGSRSSSSTAAAARRRAAAGAPTARSWPSPTGTVHGRIRITEQGETVSARYGRPGAGRALAGADDLARCCWPPRCPNPPVPRRAGARRCERLADALARALPRAGLRRPGVPALLRAGRADRRAVASSTSARGRRRGQGDGASSRCARSRGSSRGRRTGCCCRPGTARARRWPRASSSCSARCGATGRSSAA